MLAVVGMDNVGLLARLQGTVVITFLTAIINCVTAFTIIFTPIIIHYSVPFTFHTQNLSSPQILFTIES